MLFRTLSRSLFITVVYSCILTQWTWAATNYCNYSALSCPKGQQTMCLYSKPGPATKCQQYTPVPLKQDEIQSLLTAHNNYRSKVAEGKETRGNPGPQPSASNMKILKWDPELAQVAQRWADQCNPSGHDKCRDVDRFLVGQNINTRFSVKPLIDTKIDTFITGWSDEAAIFNKNDVGNYRFNADWGHYSQLVWANTEYIGCGQVHYWDAGRKTYLLKLVCNYGPTGNYEGQKLYEVGKPGSKCPRGANRNTPSLCN